MLFQKSADSKILESVLSEVKVGETITYEALSKAIGRDVRQFAPAALRSARQGILKEKRIVFDVEPKVGLVRLDDSAIVDSTVKDRKSLYRKATKATVKLGCVDFGALAPDKKREHVVASAQLGTIAMFAHKKSANKIESKIRDSSLPLPIGDTLKMFS